MAWYAAQKKRTKKDICMIYIFIYIWKCIEHVWSTQSHPWHISPGFYFQRATGFSPSDWTNKWLYVSFICVRARRCLRAHSCASFSRQKCCCHRLPESGALLIPAGFRTPKRNTGAHTHTHTHGCAPTPVDVSHDRPQISLFNKPGAFIF